MNKQKSECRINKPLKKRLKSIRWKPNEHGVWHVRNGSVCLLWINKREFRHM